MKKSLIHRILLTLILGVFVLATASAQDAVFLHGSTHKATLALHAGNACEWKIYKVLDFADQKDANPAAADEFTFKDGIDNAANVDITWKKPGKYYLIVEEFNDGLGGCSTRRAFAIEVIESATIEFKELVSNDCSNVGNTFETELTIGTSGIDDSKFYPIQVYYSIDGAPVATPITVTESKSLVFNDLAIIPEHTDKNQIITILSAKDKYGGDIKVTLTGGVNIHTRTLYGIPIVDDINY
ncbi:hypothetical protein GCQ56_11345 [Marinifilum sp. N1E240]|uniref:hypothetical protein n=1 Tax=Marinifilum sp. N1E240 TaxID=2608082 RepID=UPI00128B410B|nr:hypothetical protein [Marinifilum sp. N1E240]MPQ47597.1 hypothetical protein [Marinifilum sp. N1E240]